MLNAAIIGLGRWGRTLVDSVQKDGKPLGDKLRVDALVTRTISDEVRAYAKAQQLRIATFDEVLADRSIGAVLIATPHSQHGAQIVAAAKAGKHVFCDKPFTLTRVEAEAGFEACRKAGVVLAAGFNRRFLPATQALRAAIGGGKLGQVLHLEAHFSGSSGLTFQPGMWRASADESPAGGMGAMGIHMVDQLIWHNGPIASVACLSRRQHLAIEMDDTTSMLFRFVNGSTGYLATLTATARCWRLQALGTKGWMQLSETETEHQELNGKNLRQGYDTVDIERAELEAFAAAVAGGPGYPVPQDEVGHGVSVMEAIARSAHEDGAWTVVQRTPPFRH